ncbi:hypothetical protein DLJ53_16895 [Acuticoccus sediminis]|uniref:HTH tetR-type domain-containing protein n=1 Tax=Acuticoccus sediminis TaxID=2184697 RepID=A0A8B2NMJ9_9HYPH|nr:TetR/AcrR family transcriptional regulator [Acuticoccus sediminis]RAI00906.1 hypothetical protein DLJ53_16895 [Acuticoccus sediminis]
MQSRGASEATRARILDVAQQAFATRPYDAVSLRQIARDVGIDVALVHRTFGSKEGLFVDVMEHAFGDSHAQVRGPGDLKDILADTLFERNDKAAPSLDRLNIVLRSFSHPTAKQIIRDRLKCNMLDELASRLPPPQRERAAVLMSLMLGSVILRNVLQVDGLANDDGAAEKLFRQVVELLETP